MDVTPPPEIEIQIVDEQQLAIPSMCTLLHSTQWDRPWAKRADKDGKVVFDGLPDATYTVEVPSMRGWVCPRMETKVPAVLEVMCTIVGPAELVVAPVTPPPLDPEVTTRGEVLAIVDHKVVPEPIRRRQRRARSRRGPCDRRKQSSSRPSINSEDGR